MLSLSQELRSELARRASGAVEALASIKKHLPVVEQKTYSLMLALDMSPDSLRHNPLSNELRKSAAFIRLFSLAKREETLFRILIGVPRETKLTGDPHSIRVLEAYVELVLLRVVCTAHEAGKNTQLQIEDFVDFLDSPDPKQRLVVVPLSHLELSADSVDLGEFGVLRNIDRGRTEEPEGILAFVPAAPRCVLRFHVSTGKFLGVRDLPLSEVIAVRVALLRLVVHPLISYNHFTIEHYHPWEFEVRDLDFAGRFWSRGGPNRMEPSKISEDNITDILALKPRIDGVEWSRVTPWRLAVDRLEDAVFKVECGSPDAILDLVIGLEGLFVTAEDKQESTHKVATRVARFLEGSHEERKATFQLVKKLYGLRSKIAHGQKWELDLHGVKRVEEASRLLVRILRKLLETGRTQINVEALDLG